MAGYNLQLARTVKVSAIYDLVTCLPLAVPGLALVYLHVLEAINNALGLGGSIGELSPLALMFINFLGGLISIWAVLRLINPSWANGLTDVAVRVLFLVAMLNAILLGVPGLVVVLWVCEFAILVGLAYYVVRVWRSELGGTVRAPAFFGGRSEQAQAPAE